MAGQGSYGRAGGVARAGTTAQGRNGGGSPGGRRGYRYITRQLRHDGLIVNHRRVLRLLREDNLLGLRRRPFVPATTDARHPWPVVPNLARDMQLNAVDQLWVADITPAFARAGSISGSPRNSPIWRSSSTLSAAVSSVGRWPIISAPAW